ncbi:MAG: TAT-variant-translocated molybdopterin oxidoreductase, partial [Bacteroidota bacterium]
MIELPIVDANSITNADEKLKYWRSASDLNQDQKMLKVADPEFMPGADEPPTGASRRQFIQLMGASMAMAGLAGCRRPVELTLPYSRKPEETIPGIAMHYATSMPYRGTLLGLLVKSYEGRPTKVEGNPEHPVSKGATGLFEQASILNLYDPDRSKQVRKNGDEASWNDFVAFCQGFVRDAGSRRVAVLCEANSSPTMSALQRQLEARFPQLRWVTYAAEGDDPVRMGMQMAYNAPLRPVYQFERASVVVSFDADFLSPVERNFVQNMRGFSASRKLENAQDDMSRLYVIESNYSVTGSAADNRLRLKSSDIAEFAAAVAVHLQVDGVEGVGARFVDHPYAVQIAKDLRRAGSSGVVLAGETQPPEIHALCAAINNTLNCVDNTVILLDTDERIKAPQSDEFRRLVSDMSSGSLDALLVIGVNPVYDHPGELDFQAALQRVDNSIHVGLHYDETAALCTWHVPRSHYLEAWGDGRAYDGTLSVVQPLIAPLFDTKSELEILQTFATGLSTSGYDLVRAQWETIISGDFDREWQRVLHDGYLVDSSFQPAVPTLQQTVTGRPTTLLENAIEVVFRLDQKVLDGSFANNVWCQELPDPVTKLVWDNVAIMSPATAAQLELSVDYVEGQHYSDVVKLTVNNNEIELPVWIVPGHADNSVSVHLGYGREIESKRPERKTGFFDLDDYTDVYGHGAVSTGVGKNVSQLRIPTAMRIGLGAIEKTGERYMLATTQDHGYLEGRPMYRMATLEEYRANPHFADDAVHTLPGGEPWEEYPTLWEERHPKKNPAFKDNPYQEYQWSMVVDLNACTGCSACIVACQSENNIPVVGKQEVSRGREMHWLRMDRYYVSEEGNEENPMMVSQPVSCMHCENAPCEQVCPVAATVHSPDGTNQMIYNRCIGTRYCANNCPYKVRRFNFFNWTKTLPV